jgi:hypothetical protein
MTSQKAKFDRVAAGDGFEIWPPPYVREVDPFHFGVHTGADGPRGRRLNPYIAREIDGALERSLRKDRVVVVLAAAGAGATRTVYEALNRVRPRARLLIPRRPGEFAPEELLATDIEGETVLWIDKLGSHWGVAGARLIEVFGGWLRHSERWLVAACYDGEPDVLNSHEFERLSAAALRLDSDLTPAEVGRMREIYGDVPTMSSIGVNPPLPKAAAADATPPAPEPDARDHVRLLDDEPVGSDGDELGRKAVATALEEQLQGLVETFPGRSFFVHVDGAWGAGKSTLLRFLRESVDGSTGSQNNDWLAVPYDAWRQSRGGPPWLTLLQAVRTGVRSTQRHAGGRALFWLRERARLIGTWQWVALVLMAVAAAALAVLFACADVDLTLSKSGDIAKLVGGLVPVVGTLWLIAKSAGHFVSLDSRRSARNFLETRADPMEDLAAHFYWLLRSVRKPVLLLLIDDVDRCPEAFVVDLLDSVQKLMRDHGPGTAKAGAGPTPTLLVVVAADGRWVRSSYDNAYASLAEAVHEPGATVGTLFLEKLFQITVPVPHLPDALKAEYLRALLAERSAGRPPSGTHSAFEKRLTEAPHDQVLNVLASGSVMQRIRASQVAIDRLVVQPGAQDSTRHALEPYASLLDPTPRAMKRFVMAYSMLRAVRTAEGSVVGVGPLALWTIRRTRWPMLASFLQSAPEAVRLFTEPAGRIPPTVPAALVPLFTDPPRDLRAVMNHPDGPMDATTISECSGQALGNGR